MVLMEGSCCVTLPGNYHDNHQHFYFILACKLQPDTETIVSFSLTSNSRDGSNNVDLGALITVMRQ